MKSAKALSLLISLNSDLFWGLTWRRRLTPSIKEATEEINPDKNELNGKVPTKRQ